MPSWAVLPPELAGPPTNIFRASLHPDGLAAHTVNFDEWARHLLGQLRRAVAVTGDPELRAVEEEVTGTRTWSPSRTGPRRSRPAGPASSCRAGCASGGTELSLFTTLATFGTPRDVTLDELAVELFFPADEATDAVLRVGDRR